MYVNFFKLTTKIYDKKMYHFEKSVIMDCPIEKAFAFHKDTNNLKLISPSSVKTEIIKIEQIGRASCRERVFSSV